MSSRRLVPALVRASALALFVTLTAPTSAWAQSDTPSEAQLLFSNGVELLQQTPPNYQDAYNQFRLAYEKSGGSWKVLGNLGLCALNLERDGEALAHYRKYLDEGGSEIDPGERASIEKELLLLQGNMATVTLEASEPDVKVTVRREGASAPAQSYSLKEGKAELGLRSGSLLFTAESKGKKVSWEAVLTPGQTVSHTFDFSEPAATPVASGAASTEGSGLSTLQWTGVGVASVGGLALIGGVVTGLLAKSGESDALDPCRGTICPEESEGKLEDAATMAMMSNILFIGGGVLAASGVTLILVGGKSDEPESSSASTARLQISPAPVWGGGGIFATGNF